MKFSPKEKLGEFVNDENRLFQIKENNAICEGYIDKLILQLMMF